MPPLLEALEARSRTFWLSARLALRCLRLSERMGAMTTFFGVSVASLLAVLVGVVVDRSSEGAVVNDAVESTLSFLVWACLLVEWGFLSRAAEASASESTGLVVSVEL